MLFHTLFFRKIYIFDALNQRKKSSVLFHSPPKTEGSSSGGSGKKSPSSSFSAAFLHDKLGDLCLEKRAFYRAVSGLHTSITIHLCANYLLRKADSPFASPVDKFGPNLEEFSKRFDPETTDNEGPFWLRNLYFVYLLELRALTKVRFFRVS